MKAHAAFLKEYRDFHNEYLNMYGTDTKTDTVRLFWVYKRGQK